MASTNTGTLTSLLYITKRRPHEFCKLEWNNFLKPHVHMIQIREGLFLLQIENTIFSDSLSHLFLLSQNYEDTVVKKVNRYTIRCRSTTMSTPWWYLRNITVLRNCVTRCFKNIACHISYHSHEKTSFRIRHHLRVLSETIFRLTDCSNQHTHSFVTSTLHMTDEDSLGDKV